MAALDFLEKELKVKNATIISSKLSSISSILWIEVQNSKTADWIQKQSSYYKREARAIMYPPQELFRTIKSIEQNCKEAKKTNPNLRYQVKLGPDNIELWTKLLREPQYTKQSLTAYGNIEEPNIDKIVTTPNFGQSPPKGQDTNFKRPRESNDDSMLSPKRHLIMVNELRLSPKWNMPFQSTVISPPKEQWPNKIVQTVREMIKPPTPPRRRTRSQSGTKEPLTNIEQTEINNENSNKKQSKTSPVKKQVNKGKVNQNSSTKGEKTKIETTETTNQQKQNNKENTTRTSEK